MTIGSPPSSSTKRADEAFFPPDVARRQTIRAYVDAETGWIYARENLSKRGADAVDLVVEYNDGE